MAGRAHEREAAALGGLDRGAGGEQRRLVARLGVQTVSGSSQVVPLVAPNAVDVRRGVHALDLLGRAGSPRA